MPWTSLWTLWHISASFIPLFCILLIYVLLGWRRLSNNKMLKVGGLPARPWKQRAVSFDNARQKGWVGSTYAANIQSCLCRSRCRQGNGWFCNSCLDWYLKGKKQTNPWIIAHCTHQGDITVWYTYVMFRRWGLFGQQIGSIIYALICFWGKLKLNWIYSMPGVTLLMWIYQTPVGFRWLKDERVLESEPQFLPIHWPVFVKLCPLE